MTAKRNLSANRLLPLGLSALLLALGAASATAAAAPRDVQMHGPNGNGGGDCAAADPVVPASVATTDSKDAKPPAKAPATRIKPIVPVRGGGDETSVHAPRWHSFLPGMFR